MNECGLCCTAEATGNFWVTTFHPVSRLQSFTARHAIPCGCFSRLGFDVTQTCSAGSREGSWNDGARGRAAGNKLHCVVLSLRTYWSFAHNYNVFECFLLAASDLHISSFSFTELFELVRLCVDAWVACRPLAVHFVCTERS